MCLEKHFWKFATNDWSIDVRSFVPSYQEGIYEKISEQCCEMMEDEVSRKIIFLKKMASDLTGIRERCAALKGFNDLQVVIELLESQCETLEEANLWLFVWDAVELRTAAR